MNKIKIESTEDLINKWIICDEGIGMNIPKYSIGRVTDISDVIYTDHFTIPAGNLDKLSILPDPLYDMDVKVDDEVTLTRNYNSFKIGQKVNVDEFIDDNKTKFRTKGLVPGGFIHIKDITKTIDYTPLRLKTFLECCVEFGANWQISNCRLPRQIIDILGDSLSNHIVKNNKNMFFIGSAQIPGFYLTTEPKKEKNYEIVFKSEEEWKKLKMNYSAEGFVQIASSMKTMWGKPLKPYLTEKQLNWSIIKIIKIINNDGGIRDKSENLIDPFMLEVIELK